MTSHSTDGVSFAFGLVFLGVALLWAVSQVIPLAPAVIGWFVIGTLAALAVAGIAGAATAARRHPDNRRP